MKNDSEQIDIADFITGKLPVKASSYTNRLGVGRVATKMIDRDRLDLLDVRFEPDDGRPWSIAKQPPRLPGFSIWIEAQE